MTVGHGVADRMLEDVGEVPRLFFDLPDEEKTRVHRPAPDVSRGYVSIEGESVGRSRDSTASAGMTTLLPT